MLKLGPVTISWPGRVQLKAAPSTTGEKGAPTFVRRFGRSGTALSVSEVDYLADMQPPTRWTTVAKMLSDDAVGAAYKAMTLPILATGWTVEPGVKGAAGQEMADFLQADLDGMTGGLFKHRQESLGFLPDGVRVFEKVFEIREDGLLHLRKLALRPNGSITEWMVDERGGPTGVIQLDIDAQEVELEIARLLILTNEGEGANLTGRSVFRSAYKAWWYKDRLEHIAYIAAERNAVGVPVGTQTGDDDDVADAIEAILQAIRAHDSGFVRETDQFKFRIEGLTGDRVDPLPLLQDFRRGVFVSVLADFLALGDSSAGSWALSRDKSSFFVMALGAIIENIESAYNRYLVTPWVRANWGDIPVAELPRITHGPLNTRNVEEWVNALGTMVERGVIYPDPQIEAMGREILELPEKAGKEVAPRSAEDRAAQQPNEPGEKPAALPGVNVQQAAAEPPRLESLVKIEALGIKVRFKEVEGALDRGEEKMVAKLTKLQEKQARRLASRAAKLVKAGDWAKLAEERVPSDEEAAAIEEELVGLYGFGYEEYGRELQSQGVKPITAEDKEREFSSRALLAAFAVYAGSRLADRMLTALGAGAFGPGRDGSLDQSTLATFLVDGVGKLLADLARQGASIAFGQGRTDAGAANAGQVAEEIYSTMLDSRVCDACAPYEGKTFKVGDGPAVPNPACRGGDRCRCVRVPVAEKS